MRRVQVLVNLKSGLGQSPMQTIRSLEECWDADDIDLIYQISRTVEDGKAKVRRAIESGVDTILVVGGDGMVNSIGPELIGTAVTLGVIPTGSGNGFARHFGIPLDPQQAARALRTARSVAIDVGTVNGRPFFVTCSLAADANLVKSFEKSPVRGIVPYVFAAAYELFDYKPQPHYACVDGEEEVVFQDPIVFTTANLTPYGGGAQIAPQARADDGRLELVVVQRKDLGALLPMLTGLFDGTFDRAPGVFSRRFRTLDVRRAEAAPVQVDGELAPAAGDVQIRVLNRALRVLIPAESPGGPPKRPAVPPPP
jgi:diacylglycerol kinase family enzyme